MGGCWKEDFKDDEVVKIAKVDFVMSYEKKKVLEKTLRLFCEPMEGVEPTTPRLQITCSGQLSYIGNWDCKYMTFYENTTS